MVERRRPVLVVDPERNRGRLLARRLLREGFEANAVGNLDEAVHADASSSPFVLIDLALMCGPCHHRLGDVMDHFVQGTEYRCNKCGRHVLEVAPGRGPLSCCGAVMEPVAATAPMEEKEGNRC